MIAYHKQNEAHNSDVQLLNCRLIQRCVNSLSREQEFSAPEVVSYLVGWGDRYVSHHFETIHWSSVTSLLKKTYLQLSHVIQHTPEGGTVDVSDRSPQASDIEYAVLEIHEGSIRLQDQIHEYIDCSTELEGFNYLKYFLNTYDLRTHSSNSDLVPKRSDTSIHLSYKEEISHAGHVHTLRQDNHETIPHIPGPWFPHADDPASHSFYCALIPALLKPWRNIMQLKEADENFLTDEEEGNINSITEESITDEDIMRAANGTFGSRERVYADVAMNIAEEYRFFERNAEENLVINELANVVTDQQWADYLQWDNIIHNEPDAQDISAMDV
ncbi:uncharacterized protein F5891DRAFT_1181971 [Suillus fuscotomentosus]|uniref:Uncharacterized protein n=1 Tax=Suillus fuscotomentosus TaxID=1912939 RepID=A0AAD4EI43_9AGAM|nr:uncharacterized protein F5891DRAFT_1181971 [Suillus fuscotomentosus]KAG1906560.1 hypothetical protein F5891DRAFT_1181971 [Suillus fuscotomentosus]